MKKILVGCGLIALALVIVGIVGSVIVTSWIKEQLPDTEALQAGHDELVRLYGERDDFVPGLDGGLGSDRLEVFLAIRDSLFESGRDVAGHTTEFGRSVESDWNDGGAIGKLRGVTKAARGGLGIIGHGLQYVERRTRLLLSSEMGEGEYTYLYAIAYMSWLGWDPSTALLEDRDGPIGADEVEEIHRDVRRTLVHQLENLEAALVARTGRNTNQETLLVALRRELEGSPSNRGGFPFRDTLPAAWVEALEPFRSRFETTQPTTAEELLLEVIEIEDHGPHIRFSTSDD